MSASQDPGSAPRAAWEQTAKPTTLAAPDGSSIKGFGAQPVQSDKNMGSMWTRVQ